MPWIPSIKINQLWHGVPLKKIGLLHDDLLPEYEMLGVLGFAEGDSDYELSWEELSKPLTEIA